MGVQEAVRLAALREAVAGRISNREAVRRTGLSRRQWLRLKRRYREQGVPGVLHGNRGRPSPRRLAEETRQQIVDLLDHEVVLNDCHIEDLLAERGIAVSAETVRRIRRSLGRPPKQRRRPQRHRRRREREAQMGSMVQIDGSPFSWIGKDQKTLTLIGAIDDATGQVLSLVFRPQEDLHGFTLVLRETIEQYGVPCTLYGDRANILVRNDEFWSIEEELAGEQSPTHFGAMLHELGIRYIGALSPQAKGRVERLWRTLQDRLAAELALHGCTTMEEAQNFLPGFIVRYNRRFAIAPRQSHAAWRPRPRQLDRILACRYLRRVNLDNTIAFFGDRIALAPGPHGRSHARRWVEVRELLDGRVLVLEGPALLAERAAPGTGFVLQTQRRTREPKPRKVVGRSAPKGQLERPKRPRPKHPPKADHPWRSTYKNTLPRLRGRV